MTVENDLAAICGIDARNRPKKMAMTRALNAGDANDPAGRGGEVCPAKSPSR